MLVCSKSSRCCRDHTVRYARVSGYATSPLDVSTTNCQLVCKKNFFRAQYAAKSQLNDPRYVHFSCRFHTTGECSRAISVSAVCGTSRLLDLPARGCQRLFCGTPVTLIEADLLLHDVGYSVVCYFDAGKTTFETHCKTTGLFSPFLEARNVWTFAACTLSVRTQRVLRWLWDAR